MAAKRIALSLATATLLGCGVAHASLVELDLLTAGDGLVTLDTTTGLEWLDLTATQGLSVDQVLAGSGGWVQRGFDYPNFSQIGRLLDDAGFSPHIDDFAVLRSTDLTSDLASAITFVGDFGSTIGGFQTIGFIAPYDCAIFDEVTTCTDYVKITASRSVDRGFVSGDDGSFVTRVGQPYIGSFLAREVPEPATCATLLAGLALFAALAFRQRRAGADAARPSWEMAAAGVGTRP